MCTRGNLPSKPDDRSFWPKWPSNDQKTTAGRFVQKFHRWNDQKTTTRFSANFRSVVSRSFRPNNDLVFFCEFSVGRFSVVSTEKRPRAFLWILGCSKRTKNNQAFFCEFRTVVSSVRQTCVFIGILDRSCHSERNHESKTMSLSFCGSLCISKRFHFKVWSEIEEMKRTK